MKILHVVDMISQERAGGSAKVPFQLSAAQARLGHNVTIYTSDFQAENQEAPHGVELVKFKCRANILNGIRFTPDMAFADFKQFDVAHLHNYLTCVNWIATRKGIPCVLQAHGSCIAVEKGKIKPLLDAWGKSILKRVSYCIADALDEVGQYVVAGFPLERICVEPVGIDAKEFSHARRQPHDIPVVLSLGRFHEIKGVDLLIKAFALLNNKDARLMIAGVDYGQEANLRALVTTLGLDDRVDWVGSLYGSDKAAAYAYADVYVMPSRYEMFGLTQLEAMACGTPVILTDRCGSADYLMPECGLVVPLDEQALADAVDKALDDRMADKYRQLRIDYAKQFDWGNIAPRTIELYGEVLNGN